MRTFLNFRIGSKSSLEKITMSKQNISIIISLLLIVLAVILLAACGSSKSPATAAAGGATAGSVPEGQNLMQQRCTVCHSLNRITSAHHTATEWQTAVDRMINKGAQLSQAEEQTLVDYLAQNYK
jgi:mono/diheme cytochrome c family protein